MIKNFMKMKIDENGLPYLAEDGRQYHIDRRVSTWITSPEQVYNLAQALGTTTDAEESAYMLCLNTHLRANAVFEVTHGTIDMSLINPREIFQRALMAGAASIIMWHNHPSGETEPSSEDLQATKRIAEAGHIMGIPLQEHLIVGMNGYTSLIEEKPELFCCK